jgi:hypothetical protein
LLEREREFTFFDFFGNDLRQGLRLGKQVGFHDGVESVEKKGAYFLIFED